MNVRTISVAIVNIDPAYAQKLLDDFPYDRQRDLNTNTVIGYAEQMKNGEWGPGFDVEVAYAIGPDGAMHGYLLNGRHRLNAVILSETTQEFTLRFVAGETMEDVAWRYGQIDRQKRRSMMDTQRALGLPDILGLSQHNTRVLVAAVPFMLAGFRRGSHAAYSQPTQIALATNFGGAMERVIGYFAHGIPLLVAQSRRLGPLGVALVIAQDASVTYGEEKVADFWRGMVADDGLRNDDPRKVLARALYDTKHGEQSQRRDSNERVARVAALAWNAWVEGRVMKRAVIQDINSEVVILGTRFSKKGIKDGEKASKSSRSDEPAREYSHSDNGAGEAVAQVNLHR